MYGRTNVKEELETICSDIYKGIDNLVKGFVDTAQLIPDFSTLPVDDRAILLKGIYEGSLTVAMFCLKN